MSRIYEIILNGVKEVGIYKNVKDSLKLNADSSKLVGKWEMAAVGLNLKLK